MSSVLKIENISVDFKSDSSDITALKNVSFSVDEREILAIVGESGSGKSVTALSILKLLPKTAQITNGNILFSATSFQDLEIQNLSPAGLKKIRGNKIAMIFQEPMTSLNPVFTCGYQVSESLRLHKKMTKSRARQETLEWFRKVKLSDPELTFKKYPHQLSGGQKQRVMIAIAMCCKPSLLICDEPTTALDVTVQRSILELLKELQQNEKMAVIFITHDLGVVKEIADRIIVMYKGEIIENGTTDEIFNSPIHPYTKGLLACRPVLHKKGMRLPVVSDFLKQKNDITEIPQKVSADENMIKKNVSDNNVLLKVRNLSVSFPNKKNLFGKVISYTKAVDKVNFELFRGEILGLVGESGCGKTTLGRTLLRLIKPDSGKIIYNGSDLLKNSAAEIKKLRKDIQLIFQDPFSSLNPRLAIGPAIAEPLKVHRTLNTFRQRKEKVIELLEKVNLTAEHYNRYPHEFSGGQRQRIVIARALALNPSFIICDEPVSALDVSVQAQVLNLLNDLKKEFDFTIIFISHDLSVVRYISDRIMVMNKGKIIEQGNADEVFYSPKEEYTKSLLNAIPGRSLH